MEKIVSEESDPEDPFNNLIAILCNVRADWEVKRRILSTVGKLVDAPPDSLLPEKVAECITNPVEIRRQEEEIWKLREEVETLKAELFAWKEDATATREMAEETRRIVEQVKATLGESGMAASKAKLFDEEMHKEKKLSGSRMVWILSDFAEQVEGTMVEARKAADRIEERSQKLIGATCSKGIHLSDISLPDEFPNDPIQKEGRTPESRKSG